MAYSYLGQAPGLGEAERFVFTATAVTDTVTADDDGVTIGYTVGQVSVYLNGVKQVVGTDVGVGGMNGSTVVFASNYAIGDVIEVIALSTFSPADTVPATGGTFSGNVIMEANLTGGTGDLNWDSNTLVVDSSASRVGIGTDAPAKPLHVKSSVIWGTAQLDTTDAKGPSLLGAINGSWKWAIGTYSSITGTGTDHSLTLIPESGGGINFNPNGSSQTIAMRVHTDGNVGIGTVAPDSKMHITYGDVIASNSNTGLTVEGSGGGDLVESGINILSTGGGHIYFGDAANAVVGRIDYQHLDNSMRLYTDNTEKMRIDSSGNVGIGNFSMGSFNVQARNLVVGTGSGSQGLTIFSGNSSTGNIFFSDGTSGDDPTRGGINYNHNGNLMSFRVNDAPKMTIDSSGTTFTGTVGISGNNILNIGTSAAADIYMGPDDVGQVVRFSKNSTGDLDILTNAATLHIDVDGSMYHTGGNVGIGTVAPDSLMELSAASTTTLKITTTGGAKGQLLFERASGQGSGSKGIVVTSAGMSFVHSNNDFSSTSTHMIIDASGNVGINAVSPRTKLEIVQSSFGAGQGLRLAKTLSEYWDIDIFADSGNKLTFTNYNAGQVMTMDNTGNVGIGTVAPSSYYFNDLVVANSASSGITMVANPTNGSSTLAFADGTSGAARYAGSIDYSHATNQMGFHTDDGSRRMTIDSSGNVGIGTTAPSNYFGEYDNLVLYGSGHTGMTIATGDVNGKTSIAFADGTSGSDAWRAEIVFAHGTGGDLLRFQTGGSIQMAIDTSGRVGIGATVHTDSSHVEIEGAKGISGGRPSNQLSLSDSTAMAQNVGGAISFAGRYQGDTAKVTFGSIEGVKENVTSGNYNGKLIFKTRLMSGDNREHMTINSSGNVGIGSAAPSIGDFMSGSHRVLTIGTTTANQCGALELFGNTTSNGESTGEIHFVNSSNATSGKTNAVIKASRETADDDADITFWTQPTLGVLTERMRINARYSGRIDIKGTGGLTTIFVNGGNVSMGDDVVWDTGIAANTAATTSVQIQKGSAGGTGYPNALFYLSYGQTAAVIIAQDAEDSFRGTDVSGKFCVISSSSAVRVINRLGFSTVVSVQGTAYGGN